MNDLSEPNTPPIDAEKSAEHTQPMHPCIGDRVFVMPAKGELVQRGADLFDQFLPQAGAWVVWDSFHVARIRDGSIVMTKCPGDPHVG